LQVVVINTPAVGVLIDPHRDIDRVIPAAG
jgi:hypothetical protein